MPGAYIKQISLVSGSSLFFPPQPTTFSATRTIVDFPPLYGIRTCQLRIESLTMHYSIVVVVLNRIHCSPYVSSFAYLLVAGVLTMYVEHALHNPIPSLPSPPPSPPLRGALPGPTSPRHPPPPTWWWWWALCCWCCGFFVNIIK